MCALYSRLRGLLFSLSASADLVEVGLFALLVSRQMLQNAVYKIAVQSTLVAGEISVCTP